MFYIIPSNARVEKIDFPNKMQVRIDYGIIWEEYMNLFLEGTLEALEDPNF